MAEKVPSDQYVLLVDPLGFTEAVKTSSGGRMNALIELMRWISTARPEFGVRVAPDGNFITPDISTFSDLAVISFPATPPLDLPPDEAEIALGLWPGEVLRHMAELVARITLRSLPLGLVVRGGLCRGELLHTADLVFGPAFIEAYRLERKVAVLPRIAVCKTVYGTDRSLFADLLRDDAGDEVNYLDYMPALSVQLGARLDHAAWRASRLDEMDSYVAQFALPQPGIAVKWAWYRQYFERGTSGI